MERKLTTKTTLISIALSAIIALFFIFRRSACDYYWPEMAIDGDQWDFGNLFTNNVFAVVFFLSFTLNRILCRDGSYWVIFFVDVVLGISGSDIIDRFYLHIYDKTKEDNALLIFTIIVTAVWLVVSYKIKINVNNSKVV